MPQDEAGTIGTAPFGPLDRGLGRLGLGTLRFTASTAKSDVRVIDAFVEQGGSLVDTAAMYQQGESERVLGQWLGSGRSRDSIVLLVKGGYPDPAGNRRIKPDELRADINASLDRLGTDHIDIFMPHTDDPDVPVGEIVDCLDEFVSSGVARSVGASNWDPTRLSTAITYAVAHGRVPFTSSSAQWSLARRVAPFLPGNLGAGDPASRTWYRSTGLPLFTWSSLALGYFAGPPVRAERPETGSYNAPDNAERRRRAWALGERVGRSGAQVALAWILNQPERPFALLGMASLEHVSDAAVSTTLELTSEELDWLDLVGDTHRPWAR